MAQRIRGAQFEGEARYRARIGQRFAALWDVLAKDPVTWVENPPSKPQLLELAVKEIVRLRRCLRESERLLAAEKSKTELLERACDSLIST